MKIRRIKIIDVVNVVLILGLAVLIWFFVQQEIVDTSEIEFKVYFQLPENQNLVVLSYSIGGVQNPEKVALTLRGSKAKLTELLIGETRELQMPVMVDPAAIPADAPLKQKIMITDDMLRLPANVTLADKVYVTVLVDAIARDVECKVRLNYNATPEEAPTLPVLPAVKVTGPRSIVNNSLVIKTEPVNSATFASLKDRELSLIDRAADYDANVKVRPDLLLVLDRTKVKVTAQEQKVELLLENVPIILLGTKELLSDWTVDIPGGMTRNVTVLVPANREEEAKNLNKAKQVHLVLDLTTFEPSKIDPTKPPPSPQTLTIRPDWIVPKEEVKILIQTFKRTHE